MRRSLSWDTSLFLFSQRFMVKILNIFWQKMRKFRFAKIGPFWLYFLFTLRKAQCWEMLKWPYFRRWDPWGGRWPHRPMWWGWRGWLTRAPAASGRRWGWPAAPAGSGCSAPGPTCSILQQARAPRILHYLSVFFYKSTINHVEYF